MNALTDQSPNISRRFLYLAFFFAFYLLSTSAISFTISRIYVPRAVSFLSVLLAIPRTVLRVFITSICALFLKTANDVARCFIGNFFIHPYHAKTTIKELFLKIIDQEVSKDVLWWLLFIIFFFFYFAVNGYLTALWHLASVISVAEPNVYGISALKKSNELLRQKTGTALAIVFCHFANVSITVINVVFIMKCPPYFVVRFLLISFYLISLTGGNFVALFVQNAFYYGCKSHHNQVIDKKVLNDHLSTIDKLVKENGVEGWKSVGA